MAGCPSFDPLAPYVTSVVGFVDCHARNLGEAGYQALGSGSPIGMAIIGLITIYIALIGYRLLLGDSFGVRDGVSTAVKIGLVLALATQWSAYRTLVYDVAITGPGEIASRILAPSGLGGDDRAGLAARVQGAYSVLDAVLHPDPAGIALVAPANEVQAPAQSSAVTAAARGTIPAPGFLAASSLILLVSTLAGLLAVRVVAGLLLALGPIFIGCFLFEAMRGLFVGWLRGLIGAALGAIAAPTVIAIELAILEPQIRLLAQIVDAGAPVPILPGEILATSALFALVLLATLIGTVRVATGLRFPDAVRRHIDQLGERGRSLTPPTIPTEPRVVEASAIEGRSRALMIAEAVTDLDRRESSNRDSTADTSRAARLSEAAVESRDDGAFVVQPLGQRGRRITRRLSQGAVRRDARA